jgi:hypothetical protein
VGRNACPSHNVGGHGALAQHDFQEEPNLAHQAAVSAQRPPEERRGAKRSWHEGVIHRAQRTSATPAALERQVPPTHPPCGFALILRGRWGIPPELRQWLPGRSGSGTSSNDSATGAPKKLATLCTWPLGKRALAANMRCQKWCPAVGWTFSAGRALEDKPCGGLGGASGQRPLAPTRAARETPGHTAQSLFAKALCRRKALGSSSCYNGPEGGCLAYTGHKR